MACTSGCPTPGAHASWGECARAKKLRVAYCQSAAGRDFSEQRRVDRELDAYRAARRQGVQPETTRLADTQAALEMSDRTGVAFDAGAD